MARVGIFLVRTKKIGTTLFAHIKCLVQLVHWTVPRVYQAAQAYETEPRAVTRAHDAQNVANGDERCRL